MEARFIAVLILFGCIGCAVPSTKRPVTSYAPHTNCAAADGFACTNPVEMLLQQKKEVCVPGSRKDKNGVCYATMMVPDKAAVPVEPNCSGVGDGIICNTNQPEQPRFEIMESIKTYWSVVMDHRKDSRGIKIEDPTDSLDCTYATIDYPQNKKGFTITCIDKGGR